MEDNHLSLLNDPDLPTRVGQHARQGDTTTDLPWTNRRRALFWELGADTWGSDHLPIFIRLRGHKITAPKRTTSVVCWEAFRAELEQTPVTTPGGDPETHDLAHLLRTIHEAKRSSTQHFQVAEDKPSPDLHLANLWQQRLDALCAYRERGRTPGLRCRLNLITTEARDYANTLSTDRWCDLCSSFNGNMSGPRILHIFRNSQGKAKRPTAAQTAALRMRISEEQVALQAGAVFFPQPAASPDPTIYSRDSATPFQMMGDFQALDLQTPEQLLLDAINKIWTTGNFPSSWLESLVIPIRKPGKPPNELTNLRPITLTSNLCKLTERMVLERLMWHIERNYPLHPHQLGFRHGMSTQDILLMLRHQVLDAYSKVQTRTVVAVDVRKTFDTVPHEAIIQSAELAGVCGHLLNFVKSFLNDRTYTIKAGDYIGTAQPNRTGVPQGAVLSPTLFNLVMARLPPLLEAVPSLHFALYADDVTIWATTGLAGEQEHTLQLGLDVIQGFLRNVGMTTSAEKTEYVVVLNGPHKKTEAVRNQIALSMAGQRIWRKPSVQILGAYIHQDGKGTTQAEQLEKLNREAIRIVTGLPKYTPLRELYAHGGMNLLSELAEQALLAQRDRLSSLTAGLSILEELGVPPSLDVRPADAHSPPPWAAPLNIQATISWVPAHAGIDGNEWAHSEARAAVRQMASAPNAFHNSAGEAAGPADPSVVKESAKQRRRRILRHFREEREERLDEQLRSVPPMPNNLPRSTQTLVRRLATNTVLSPALRHKFFGDDPDEGACRRCRSAATAAHVVWECERHASLRKTKLEELPDEIHPATYVD
ncbi:hypothetical protein ISCGN_005974 [Ixodes scapularis]